jgi:phosphoglucosamine mutase
MKLFGTDGIRGKANEFPITEGMMIKIGKATAQVLKGKGRKYAFLIGKDTRESCAMVQSALSEGFLALGASAVLADVLPTPGLAFLTKTLDVDGGVMISASHNPYHDNGIKIFSANGFKLPDSVEQAIESLIESDFQASASTHAGTIYRVEDGLSRYVGALKTPFQNLNLQGLNLVVDCAHGATYKVGPELLSEMGAHVVATHNKPDGKNINFNCGSTDTAHLRQTVKERNADAGIAFDGDGDRVILCDEKGRLTDGDQIIAICALDMKKKQILKNNGVVTTVMSNIGVERYLNERGVQMIRAKVGDRYVVEAMLGQGYNLGGEQSGHIIFLDHSSTGDGIMSALQILSIMKTTGQPLSALAESIPLYPQTLVNVSVSQKRPLSDFPAIEQAVKLKEKALEGGRILIRPSGTEPKIRVMVEGPDAGQVQTTANELAAMIQSAMQ